MVLARASAAPDVQPFALHTGTRGATTTVTVLGEVDLATAGRLDRELQRANVPGVETLVVDLSRVGFISSSGLHVLMRIDNAVRARGSRLLIVRAPPAVQSVFDLTGLDEHLSFVESRPPSGAA